MAHRCLRTAGKVLAVGLIEAIDVFLIAIVALIIGLGLIASRESRCLLSSTPIPGHLGNVG
jgi:hypothetical protein